MWMGTLDVGPCIGTGSSEARLFPCRTVRESLETSAEQHIPYEETEKAGVRKSRLGYG